VTTDSAWSMELTATAPAATDAANAN
jgi:hypothetical protein